MEKKEVQNDVRDIINWLAVFEEEYELPAEVVEELRVKLESVSQKVDRI